MKTTVDVPEAPYRRAKIRAAEEGPTLRALLLTSLAASLDRRPSPADPFPHRERFEVDDRGWPVLSVRPATPPSSRTSS